VLRRAFTYIIIPNDRALLAIANTPPSLALRISFIAIPNTHHVHEVAIRLCVHQYLHHLSRALLSSPVKSAVAILLIQRETEAAPRKKTKITTTTSSVPGVEREMTLKVHQNTRSRQQRKKSNDASESKNKSCGS